MIPRNKVLTCDEKTTIDQANATILKNKIGSILVTKTLEDKKTSVIGIVTKTDLLKAYLTGEQGSKLIVGDYMTKSFITSNEEVELEYIAQELSSKKIHHVIIVNEKKELTGLASSLDIAKEISIEAKDTFPYLQKFFGIPKSQEDEVYNKVIEKISPLVVDDEYVLYHYN